MVHATDDRRAGGAVRGYRRRLSRAVKGPAPVAPPRPTRRFDRPDSGLSLEDRITLFHDADDGNFACISGGPSRLRITVYQFAGSYISLAVGLRKSDLRSMRPGARLCFDLDASATRPLTTFLRLNIRTPEKTETLHETLLLHDGRRTLQFQLDGVRALFGQLEAAWLDLIFSDPEMSEIDIADFGIRLDQQGEG